MIFAVHRTIHHGANMNISHELFEQWPNSGCMEEEDQIMTESAQPYANVPKPQQGLPSRSTSAPIGDRCAGGVESQADELLEDWPRRISSCSADNDTDDWQFLCQMINQDRRVSFSDRSSLLTYEEHPPYVRSKAYTKEDRKAFSSEVLQEACRIKRLVLAAPGASVKESFKYLVRNKTIKIEEVVGIEHLVFGVSSTKLLKERKDHARAVVTEQRRYHHADEKAERLGQFAALRSSKSAKHAKIRAAMAA